MPTRKINVLKKPWRIIPFRVKTKQINVLKKLWRIIPFPWRIIPFTFPAQSTRFPKTFPKFLIFQMPCTIRWKRGGVQWSTTVLESTLRAGFRGSGSAGRAPASPPSAKSGTLAPQLARVRRVARGETISVGTSRRPRPSRPKTTRAKGDNQCTLKRVSAT